MIIFFFLCICPLSLLSSPPSAPTLSPLSPLLHPPCPPVPSYCTHPVSGEHLGAVPVDDVDDAGGLNPGLPIHLHRYAFIAQDRDLHLPTLQAETNGKFVCVSGVQVYICVCGYANKM